MIGVTEKNRRALLLVWLAGTETLKVHGGNGQRKSSLSRAGNPKTHQSVLPELARQQSLLLRTWNG
jgi:hypothetical protein